MEEHSSAERKTWQVLRFEKKTIVWLDLNESTKTLNPLSAERKGKVDPYRGSEEEEKRKKEKRKKRGNQQWKVWYEESGGLEYQKQSGEYGRPDV